jgi:hypothetical protein
MDRTENTASNVSRIVASRSRRTVRAENTFSKLLH